MKTLTLMSLAMMLSIGLLGCNDTAAGVEKDASEAGQAISETTENTVKGIEEGSKDASAAATLTPMVKSAIVANPMLNDPDNSINVDANDDEVILTGHVDTEEMKKMAGDLAMEVLKDNNAKQKLRNDLVVK